MPASRVSERSDGLPGSALAIGGRYFNDCNEADVVDRRPSDFTEIFGSVAPYALDPGNAEPLWETSLRLLGG
jgi:hypothetical protein